MGKPSAPKPADPKVTAAAQTGTNVSTAIANQQLAQVNQVTPDGQLRYEQTGTFEFTDPSSGTTYTLPQYTAHTELSEMGQKIKDANDQASLNFSQLASNQSGRLDNLLSRPMDISSLPEQADLSTLKNSGDRDRVEAALMERMQGGLARDKEALEARLASQGIRLGSQAYDAAMANYGQQVNDARLGAIINAGQEQTRGLNNQIAIANAQNNNRAQAMQEAFAVRNQPINEITALMSGSQVNHPNFVNTPQTQMATTDYAGLVAQRDAANQNAYAQQMAGWNNMFGAAAGLGSAAIIASDRRVKENVKKVGETKDGQNIYQYNYKGDPTVQIGLMAQEVEKKRPEAVVEKNGIKHVNYGLALGGAR